MSTNNDDSPPPYQAQDPMAMIHPMATTVSLETTATTPTPTPTPGQEAKSTFYHIHRLRLGDYEIYRDDTIYTAFYVETRRVRQPDLIVHRGNDTGQEVARCRYPESGRHYEIGTFRDPNNKWSLVWHTMTLDCRFAAKVPVSGMTGSATRHFIWKRASNLMLLDEETGLVAAVAHDITFASKKCGVLEIRAPYGHGFNPLVLITFLAMYEKQRRDGTMFGMFA